MTETDIREVVARLEAKIKGPSWRAYQYSGPDTLNTNHGDWLLYDEAVPVPAGRESFHATPHDTDAGRLTWMELLRQLWIVEIDSDGPAITSNEAEAAIGIGSLWIVRLWSRDGSRLEHAKTGDFLPQAITAAVEAAALEGEKQGGP